MYRLLHVISKAILAFALAACCVEILLQCFVVKNTGGREDRVLGRMIKPGIYVDGTEGFCRTTINASGFRTGDISRKAPDEYRIIVMGDSFTSAFQVADARMYTSQLEQILCKARNHKQIRVVNLGKNGAFPGDYIGFAPYTRNLHPDYVVVQLSTAHVSYKDLTSRDKAYQLTKFGDHFQLSRSKAVGGIDKMLGATNPLIDVLRNSSLVRRVMLQMLAMQTAKQDAAQKEKTPKEVAAEESQRARMMRWLIFQLKATYPNLIILYLPNLDYSKADIESRTIPAEELTLENDCHDAEIVLLNMRKPFIDYFMRTHQPCSGFNNTRPGTGHLNERGHRCVAEVLAQHFAGVLSQ